MKVLCDVHIAFKLVRFFRAKGIEALHVNELPDSYFTKDKAICEYADKHGYVVLTKDADFLDTYLLKSTPKRLLKINLGNIATSRLIEIIESHWSVFLTLLHAEKGCIEVYDHRLVVHD